MSLLLLASDIVQNLKLGFREFHFMGTHFYLKTIVLEVEIAGIFFRTGVPLILFFIV